MHLDAVSWGATLSDLGTGEAAFISRQAGAWEQVARVRLAPGITAHVRHLTKYLDVAVAAGRSFVFTDSAGRATDHARSLKEFVNGPARASVQSIHGHLRRGDFSRWVREVFGDHVLASRIEEAEAQDRPDQIAEAVERITRTIRARYDQPASENPAGAGELDAVAGKSI